MTQLVDISLHLPLPSLRVALTALTPSQTRNVFTCALLKLEIIIADCNCDNIYIGECIADDHGLQKAREIGTLIMNMLELRGCAKTPLMSLSVSHCLANKAMEKMVRGSVLTVDCETCLHMDME